ncbi:reverse transcriptase [Penicillium sp. DV-2018c]|nr:reverse transcriptase [Penicillium sp. DV-2018c]
MYTDGSGIDGKIGAAAVVDLEDRHAHSQMGDDDTSTVFAAELRAIEMALTMAQESTEPWAEQAKNGIVIFADSQAALRAATTTHAIRTSLSVRMSRPDPAVRRQRGLDRTEMDPGAPRGPGRTAKLSQQRDTPCAAKRRIRSEAKLEWEKLWAKETTSRPTKRLIEIPTKKTLEYWSGLRKATSSILIQLRTGRIGLGAYLHRINRRDSSRSTLAFEQIADFTLIFAFLDKVFAGIDFNNWERGKNCIKFFGVVI